MLDQPPHVKFIGRHTRQAPDCGLVMAGCWQANAYLLATCYYRNDQSFRVLYLLKGDTRDAVE
jgi:hypothetical protein